MTMKPGDTVITKDGQEGVVFAIFPTVITYNFFPVSGVTHQTYRKLSVEIANERSVYVDLDTKTRYWKVFLESELKVKEEKK